MQNGTTTTHLGQMVTCDWLKQVAQCDIVYSIVVNLNVTLTPR